MLKLPAHPRNARRDPGERGFALITVLLATMMLLALASAALAYGVGSQPISRHDQDWNGALGAAQAGVDDYLARINQNQTYITSYSSSNPDPTNPAMGCSSGACPGTPKWATMSSGGQFHYGIDTSQYAQNGVIFVTATGRAAATGPGAGVMRTIQARLGRSGLLKFLYHTTYETLDPAWQGKLLGSGPFRDPYTGTMVNGQTWANDVCGGNSAYASKAYWWAGRYKYSSYNPPGPSSGAFCQDIQFAPGDVVNGPLSTDDTPVICGGATFNGAVTVGGKDPYQGKLWFNPGCGGGPNFTQGPPTVKSLPLPSTLASLKSYVTTSSGGCLYTGPTRIYLSMQGGVSGMRVQSPLSQNTVNPSQCPTGTSTSLSSWVPVPGAPKVGGGNYPGNGLILVQNVPASTTDPNYTSPSSSACTSWPKSAVSYYMAGDPSATKSCTDGDAFVQGTVNTAATIAAVDNSIVITHDSGGSAPNSGVCYSSSTASCPIGTGGTAPNNADTQGVLGLQAANFVEVFNTSSSPSPNNLEIDAAIFALNHSFIVQNWGTNNQSILTVFGTIGQKFRGPVGTSGGNGYLKNYWWDTRFGKGVQPPYFVDSSQAAWGTTQWAEIPTPSSLP